MWLSNFAIGIALPRNFAVNGNISRTDSLVETVVPVACTADTLLVSALSAPSAPMTLTLFRNGAATSLSCTVSALNVPCTSTASVALAAGDRIMFNGTGAGTSPSFAAGVRCR
jgi:hypothetical protein